MPENTIPPEPIVRGNVDFHDLVDAFEQFTIPAAFVPLTRSEHAHAPSIDLLAEDPADKVETCDDCGNEDCTCSTCIVCHAYLTTDADDVSEWEGYWYRASTRHYHDSCALECTGCDHTLVPNRDDYWTFSRYDGQFCDNCTRYCNRCDEVRIHLDDTLCSDCQYGYIDGVRGYGHTEPVMWLGGPLPIDKRTGKRVGFYMGFELEVSASNGGSIRRLREWASDNLTSMDALDFKEDSSVDGFEIASQPMTPEFFESVDWESFFTTLDREFPSNHQYHRSKEPVEHGLHVHIGRIGFDGDDIAIAMFSYLLGQGDNLERIARRDPTDYCMKVHKPASVALVAARNHNALGHTAQTRRLSRNYANQPGRNAINLTNYSTIEIRAFRSTRIADDLRAAFRLVYLAARYVMELRRSKFVSPKALHWDAFMGWVANTMPEAVPMLAADNDDN